MLKNRTGVSLYVAAGLAMAVASVARGQTNVQWAAGVNGSWGLASNWTPAQVPDNAGPSTFNVTLPNYGVLYTVTLDINRDMSKLDIVGTAQDTVLDLNGKNLDVFGNFTFNKGYVAGDGLGNRITVNGVATFSDGMYMWADFKSNGTVVFAGSATEEFCDTGFDHNGSAMTWSGTGDINIAGGTVFNHNAPSTFTISHAGNNDFYGSGIDTFNNSGTILKTGTGVTTFRDLTFNNTGTLKVQAGSVKIVGGGVITGGTLGGGKYEVEEGAEMRMTNPVNEDTPIETCNAEVTLRGATSAFVSLDSVKTIGETGKLRLEGGRQFSTVEALQNQGVISVGPSSHLNINAGVGQISINTGAIEAVGGGQVVVADGATLRNVGSVRAAAGGQVSFQPGAVLENVVGTTLLGGQFVAESGGVIESEQLASVDRLNSDVTVRGSASDIRDGVGASVLGRVRAIGPLGSLTLDGRSVLLQNDLTVEGTGNSRGHLTVAPGTVLALTPGRVVTNFSEGTFTQGRFTIRGELLADGLEIEQIDNTIVLDDDAGIIRNRTTGLDALRSLNTLRGEADVTVANGRDLITLNNLTAQQGSRLTVGAAVGNNRTTVRVAGDFFAQGSIALAGGEIVTQGNLVVSGDLRGNGQVTGLMINSGVIAPGFSAGELLVEGSYAQGALGLLEMEIGGSLQGVTYDTLLVRDAFGFGDGTGSAGSLLVSLINGFVPGDGERFTLAEFNQRIGEGFANVSFAGLSGNASMELLYEPHAIVAVYHVPAPGFAALIAGAGLLASRRRR